MSARMRYKVNQILLKLSDWSNYWRRTSQNYINNFSMIYNNVIFYRTKFIINDTI